MSGEWLQRLTAERARYRDLALRCETRADRALDQGRRSAWRYWARQARLAWRMNARLGDEIDRLTAAASHGPEGTNAVAFGDPEGTMHEAGGCDPDACPQCAAEDAAIAAQWLDYGGGD